MNLFLVLTFLFFAGSLIGWGIELFWRRFFSKNNPEKKWINPGFLNGPYLPLYGLSLVLLFTLSFIDVSFMPNDWSQKLLLFLLMALAITIMEFIAGLIFIKGMKIKLWDYSKNWLNIKGIVCPQYSFYWVILSGLYYFLVHPRILEWLYWFTDHLAFSFVVGFFYGVFFIDLCYTLQISTKIRAYAKENQLEIKYENLKEQIRKKNEEFLEKRKFFFSLKSSRQSIGESLKEIFEDKHKGV
ncbi:MAG: putative ABC transporter permease [Treponema sp.]|nr:putative ABC transporter permease [Treponema sp.]